MTQGLAHTVDGVGVPRLRLLDLFSGIGGFSLGLERTGGFETVAFCEIEPFCRRVLAKHWPKVPCYDDVRTLTAGRLAADGIGVDVISGGFPCQDISNAGNRVGIGGRNGQLGGWPWRARCAARDPQENRSHRRTRPHPCRGGGTGMTDTATTQLLQSLAAGIDKILNPDGEKSVGFALLVFPFGEPEGRRTNYVSNADRADMTAALSEVTARFQGRFTEPSRKDPS